MVSSQAWSIKNCNGGNLKEVSTNYKAEKELSLALGFCMTRGNEISKKKPRKEVRTSSGPGSSITYYMT